MQYGYSHYLQYNNSCLHYLQYNSPLTPLLLDTTINTMLLLLRPTNMLTKFDRLVHEIMFRRLKPSPAKRAIWWKLTKVFDNNLDSGVTKTPKRRFLWSRFLVHVPRLFGPLYENGCDLITNDGYAREREDGCPIYKELWGCSSQILKTIPERCQDPILWAWLVITLPLRGTYSKTKLYLLSHSYSAQYPLKVLQNYKSCRCGS